MNALPKLLMSAALLLLLLTLWSLWPTTNGALGEYFVDVEGNATRVAGVTDRAIFFPNDRPLRERVTSNWELDRVPLPHEFPPFTVRWSGTVHVPDAPLRQRSWTELLFPSPDSARDLPRLSTLAQARLAGLRAQNLSGTALTVLTDAEFTLVVDGAATESTDFRAGAKQRALTPGPHHFTLSITRRGPPISVALAFFQPEVGVVTLRGSDLELPPTVATATHRALLLAALTGLTLLISAAAFLRFVPGPLPLVGRQTRTFHICALSLFTLLGALLRFHDYALVPYFAETDDEFDIGWNGLATLQTGVPTGWFFPEAPYPEGVVKQWFGTGYFMVTPAFHRAPLMPILAGAAAQAGGAQAQFDVKLRDIRVPPIVLSLLTLTGVYVAALRLFGTSTALISSLLYAVLPLVVVGSRLCKEENALTPALLFALLAAEQALRSPARQRWIWCCGGLSGLAILAKQTGIAAPLAASMILAQRPGRFVRDVLTICTICGTMLGAWVAYCLTIDASRFWSVTSFMGSLPGGFEVPLRILLEPRIVSSHFGQGWYHWLWISFVIVALQERRTLWIPVGCYLLAIIGSAQARFVYGWYLLPFYPFLCIGAARFLERTISRPHVLAVGLTCLFAVIPALTLLLSRDVTENIQIYRATLLFLLVPSALWSVHPTPFLKRLARGHFLGLLLLLSLTWVGISLNFFSIYSQR